MTAGSVWLVALAPQRRRGQVVGWYGMAMWGGPAAGPVLGELAYATGSYGLVWAFATALPAAGLAVLWWLPGGGPEHGERVPFRLLPRAAVLPGLALAAGGFGYATVTSFGALAVADRGIAEGALLLSVFSLAHVTVRLLAAGLPDRYGPLPVILASAALEAAGLVLVAVGPVWWVAAAGTAAARPSRSVGVASTTAPVREASRRSEAASTPPGPGNTPQ